MMRALLIGILILLIARAFWRLMDGILEAAGGTQRTRRKSSPPAMPLVRDPVCGTHVSPSSAVPLVLNGATHYFCSETCRDRFRKSA